MSGHSKWAGIKHKKAIVDAKRGQAFTRASREITISAKEGGGNPDGNFWLRLAMQKAREINMPTDRIQNAIKRGTGELAGEKLEEIRYEGYGPAGVAVMVDAFTDNRNRTSASIRHRFSKFGGNLGETNSVGWMFERRDHHAAQTDGTRRRRQSRRGAQIDGVLGRGRRRPAGLRQLRHPHQRPRKSLSTGMNERN